jgi:hypothetical protein
MKKESYLDKILLSITGKENVDWQNKLNEINQLKIEKAAVFLSQFEKKERDNFYRFLLRSSIKEIPFVHLREDVESKEIEFFINNFKTRYFNIHEDHFQHLDKWQGFLDKLYLEMDFNSQIAKDVKVRRIGGFCVDLAHFKSAIVRGAEEAYYIFLRKNKIEFACNHLGGYSEELMSDIHKIKDIKSFDYLNTLPKYVFGKVMALEVENSIKEQIVFRDYIFKILNKYLL